MTHKVDFHSFQLDQKLRKKRPIYAWDFEYNRKCKKILFIFFEVVSEPFDKCFLSQASNVFTHKFVSFAFNFHWLYIYTTL